MDTNKDSLLRGDNPIANSEDPAISNEETTSSEKPYLDMTIIANEEPGHVSPNQETGPAHTGKIALTFDDGPHPSETLRLLDILDQYNAKATFFVLGKNTEYYPDIVREISNRGHEIANHTYSHPDLTSLSYGEILYELQMADQIIIEATGTKPRLVRPPYGSVDEDTKAAIRDNGQTLVTWTVDTRDWDHRDPYQSLEIVKENADLGDIILMHDVHSSSVDAVPQIIEYLQGQGYELTTVSDIL